MRSFQNLEVSRRLTTFLIDKFIKILWVPMPQKIHIVARKPLRQPTFIELQLLRTKIALIWKILGFIAWRPHVIFSTTVPVLLIAQTDCNLILALQYLYS